MKKLTSFLLGGILLLGTVACDSNAKTSAPAPSTTENNAQSSDTQTSPTNQTNTASTPQAPDAETAQENQQDATSEVRKDQLNSDIRAREQRNNATGGDADRADGDLESEVRSKLEANLPASQLTVDAKEGAVTVAGTVPTQEQFNKIESLAKEIKGVKSVTLKATVAPAKPESGNKKAQ